LPFAFAKAKENQRQKAKEKEKGPLANGREKGWRGWKQAFA
jgi:hypothetical protein